MSTQKVKSGRGLKSGRSLNTRRLALESLESREMLTTFNSIATGFVYHDVDGDNVRETGEPGLANRTVYIDANRNNQRDPRERMATTNRNGYYLFDNVKSGRADIRLESAEGFSGPEEIRLRVRPRTFHSGNHFGQTSLNRPATGTGFVFVDADNDNLWDRGEGLANRVVYVDANQNGNRDAGETFARTSSTGFYRLNVPTGFQTIRLEPRSGYQTVGATSQTYSFTAGSNQSGINFEQIGNTTPTLGSVTGFVFQDANRDGFRNHGEIGNAWTRVFVDANNNGRPDFGERSQVTGNSGFYRFDNLPAGTSTIRMIVPPGQHPTVGTVHYASVENNRIATANNFGVSSSRTLGEATGFVFRDANLDGQRDSGESGAYGAIVYADHNGNGRRDAGEQYVRTGSSGFYRFSLPAQGSIPIRLASQTGQYSTSPNSILVNGGGNSTANNFGLAFTDLTNSVSGFTYFDQDQTGTRTTDPGLANRTVELTNLQTREVQTYRTSSNGYFVFDGLQNGMYQLRVVNPGGLNPTTDLIQTFELTTDASLRNFGFFG